MPTIRQRLHEVYVLRRDAALQGATSTNFEEIVKAARIQRVAADMLWDIGSDLIREGREARGITVHKIADKLLVSEDYNVTLHRQCAYHPENGWD